MLRSTTAPKATGVAERDMLMEKPRLAFTAAALIKVAPEAVCLGSPRKISLNDDPPSLI